MHDEVEVNRKNWQFKFKIRKKLISEWVLEDDNIIQSIYSSVYPEAFYKLCTVHILTMYCTLLYIHNISILCVVCVVACVFVCIYI